MESSTRTSARSATATAAAARRRAGFDTRGELGRGGRGLVYRARQQTLGREVALKLLPRAFAHDPQRLARFDRESRILASLNHPNIAAIHSIEPPSEPVFRSERRPRFGGGGFGAQRSDRDGQQEGEDGPGRAKDTAHGDSQDHMVGSLGWRAGCRAQWGRSMVGVPEAAKRGGGIPLSACDTWVRCDPGRTPATWTNGRAGAGFSPRTPAPGG